MCTMQLKLSVGEDGIKLIGSLTVPAARARCPLELNFRGITAPGSAEIGPRMEAADHKSNPDKENAGNVAIVNEKLRYDADGKLSEEKPSFDEKDVRMGATRSPPDCSDSNPQSTAHQQGEFAYNDETDDAPHEIVDFSDSHAQPSRTTGQRQMALVEIDEAEDALLSTTTCSDVYEQPVHRTVLPEQLVVENNEMGAASHNSPGLRDLRPQNHPVESGPTAWASGAGELFVPSQLQHTEDMTQSMAVDHMHVLAFTADPESMDNVEHIIEPPASSRRRGRESPAARCCTPYIQHGETPKAELWNSAAMRPEPTHVNATLSDTQSEMGSHAEAEAADVGAPDERRVTSSSPTSPSQGWKAIQRHEEGQMTLTTTQDMAAHATKSMPTPHASRGPQGDGGAMNIKPHTTGRAGDVNLPEACGAKEMKFHETAAPAIVVELHSQETMLEDQSDTHHHETPERNHSSFGPLPAPAQCSAMPVAPAADGWFSLTRRKVVDTAAHESISSTDHQAASDVYLNPTIDSSCLRSSRAATWNREQTNLMAASSSGPSAELAAVKQGLTQNFELHGSGCEHQICSAETIDDDATVQPSQRACSPLTVDEQGPKSQELMPSQSLPLCRSISSHCELSQEAEFASDVEARANVILSHSNVPHDKRASQKEETSEMIGSDEHESPYQARRSMTRLIPGFGSTNMLALLPSLRQPP